MQEVGLPSMGSLQAHRDDYILADFGQENHLDHHLHNFLVGLDSQVGALNGEPGVLGSQPGVRGKEHVLEVLGKLLVDTEGHAQLAYMVLGGELQFACCAFS